MCNVFRLILAATLSVWVATGFAIRSGEMATPLAARVRVTTSIVSAAPAKITPAPMSDLLLETHVMPSGIPPDRRSLLSIIYNGYRRSSLEPCGCVSHKLGGIDREAKVIERITSSGLPLIKLEAGGYIRDMATNSHVLRTASKYLLRALAALDYDALNVSATDMEIGKPFLQEAMGEKANRLISANLVDPATSAPLFATHRVLTVTLHSGEKIRIGVTGVTRPRLVAPPAANPPSYAVADPVKALPPVLEKLEKESDVIILLAYMNRDLLANDLLSKLGSAPKIDIAIAGEYLGSRNDVQNVQGVRIVSGGFEGRHVGHLILEWRDGKIKHHYNKLVDIEQTIPPKPEISKLITDYLLEVARGSSQTTQTSVLY